VECNGIVGSNFWTVNSLPSITLLASLLEQVPILLFAGDQDLICVSGLILVLRMHISIDIH
jgi:carboxypeptidase D